MLQTEIYLSAGKILTDYCVVFFDAESFHFESSFDLKLQVIFHRQEGGTDAGVPGGVAAIFLSV